jgi:hypothetical protein
VLAALRFQQGLVKEFNKVIIVHIGPQNDIPPFAAISAVRTPFWYELFAPKADTSVPAIAGFRVNPYPIDEHGSSSLEISCR